MFRSVIFWLHLSFGVLAGIIILVMSATGVALTFERQITAWTTSHLRSTPPSAGALPMPLETLVTDLAARRPDISPAGVTVSAARDAAVVVIAEPSPLYLDAFTGRELGDRRGATLREFLSTMRAWHRWLAVDGENRSIARAVTGWSNVLFLFIVVSGAYLWLPRTWRWLKVRQTLWFKRGYGTSKARDFNWHYVIGVWSAIPLFVIVLGALPISFPWANDLVYRIVGEEPPPRGRVGGPAGQSGPGGQGASGGPVGPVGQRNARGEESARRGLSIDGLNAAFERAKSDVVTWRTISVRFPRRHEEPLALSIDRGDGGQPQLRSTLTLSRSGEVISRETFADQSTGRQVRSVLRFAHTGEVFGLPGQTVAGVVSAGAVVMVWTGLALSWRRFYAWRLRRAGSGGARESSPIHAPAALAQDMPNLSSQESIS